MRRHGVSRICEFLSIPDLIKKVALRLPSDTKIRSEATVRYAFAPPNMHFRTSKYYTGIVNLKYVVQRRQLRAFHTDARELAVIYREDSVFLSCDDKSKMDYGEQANVISTGVRGKKSVVLVNSVLGTLDHDLQSKGYITPTVSLIIDIQESIKDSFHRGRINIQESIKDSFHRGRINVTLTLPGSGHF